MSARSWSSLVLWTLPCAVALTVQGSARGQETPDLAHRDRARAFSVLRAPLSAGYELREIEYRLTVQAKLPLPLSQLDALETRRAAGIEDAKRLFAALESAAKEGSEQGLVIQRTERRWSIAYNQHVYREVEISESLGSFPARVQTKDVHISWNRDSSQLDIAVGSKGWPRRDLGTLMAPLPLASEVVQGLQGWKWIDDNVRIDGQAMRQARGHAPGHEHHTWELCFDPSNALPQRFCVNAPDRWSLMWFAYDAEAEHPARVPTRILRVRRDKSGHRVRLLELSAFSEAEPEAADLVITVPANTNPFVFENGRTRMLGADRSRWPDPVKWYVRFEH